MLRTPRERVPISSQFIINSLQQEHTNDKLIVVYLIQTRKSIIKLADTLSIGILIIENLQFF